MSKLNSLSWIRTRKLLPIVSALTSYSLFFKLFPHCELKKYSLLFIVWFWPFSPIFLNFTPHFRPIYARNNINYYKQQLYCSLRRIIRPSNSYSLKKTLKPLRSAYNSPWLQSRGGGYYTIAVDGWESILNIYPYFPWQYNFLSALRLYNKRESIMHI